MAKVFYLSAKFLMKSVGREKIYTINLKKVNTV